MNILSIASGSSGNCYYVGNDHTHLLVDVGITGKRVEAALHDLGIKADELNGILITHEHNDHIKGLGVLSRKYGIPIYTTEGCIKELQKMSSVGKIDDSLFQTIQPDISFTIGDITVNPSSVWHDTVDPVCYSLYDGNKKISIATDLGNFDDYMIDKLKDSDIMLIEANHDIRMLEAGSYPYYLKRRILGNHGHLSNERAGQLIKSLLNDHIKAIILGHLSRENNFEELAYQAVSFEIQDNAYSSDVRDFGLIVAKRDKPGTLIST